MQSRMNPYAAAPEAMKAMMELEAKVQAQGLEQSLVNLVKVRASQINGCAFCLNMHTAEARAAGEIEARLHLLNAWREAPCYSRRERAALAWTDALTRIADTHAPDEDYELLREHFSDDERVKLTLAIVAINGWNRFAISFRMVPDVKPPEAA